MLFIQKKKDKINLSILKITPLRKTLKNYKLTE